jgi:hypothetical protein
MQTGGIMPAEDHGRHKGAVEFGGQQRDDQGVTSTLLVVFRTVSWRSRQFFGDGCLGFDVEVQIWFQVGTGEGDYDASGHVRVDGALPEEMLV